MKVRLLLFLIIGLSACSQKTEETSSSKRPINVELMTVHSTEIQLPVVAHGLLNSKEQLKLSFKIGGIISNVYVNEGASVQEGQVLAKLDLSEIQGSVDKAKTAVSVAKQDYERANNLYQDSVATKEQLEKAEAQLNVATSDLKVAQFNYDYAVIKSPAKGKILKKLFEENEIIGAGMPILIMSNDNEEWVIRVGLSESELVKLALGDAAVIKLEAYPDQRFEGVVTEIAETLDPQSATYEIEIELLPTDQKLINGFMADVSIVPSQVKDYILIPLDALMEADANKGFVYVPSEDGKTVNMREVKLAGIIQDQAAVVSGLEINESIVTKGAAYLDDGTSIEIREPSE